MTQEEMARLVGLCSYKPGWKIMFHENKERPWIQIAVWDMVRFAPVMIWKSGKRYLSEHMCKQEIIGAVFGLIKDAEMHEIHEAFRYKGKSIFNPHLDPDALAELATFRKNFNFRENAMTMEEGKET